MTDRLRKIVLEAVARTSMFHRGSTVLVAVSGGADSSALAHVLAGLREDLGIALHIAHLDHALRGEAGEADALWVADFARSLGVPATVGWRDVATAAALTRRTVEEAARDERRDFLSETASRVGASAIALGHTRDDQAETVLLNLLRGCGVDGLRGMAPVAGTRVRPLLAASREETHAYCRVHDIAYRTDASNTDLAYRRNRVRAELLPHIESYYNPAFREALGWLASLASADAEVLDGLAEDIVAGGAVCGAEGVWRMDAATVLAQPLGLRRRIVRRLAKRVVPGLVDLELDAVEAVLAAACGERGPVSWTVPGGAAMLGCDGCTITAGPVQAPASHLPVREALPVPGCVTIGAWGATVEAAVLAGPEAIGPCAADSVQVPLEAIAGGLLVRSRLPGDRIRPLGLGGSRKIQDILTDHKVPARERDAVPIVADEAGPLWVAGHVLSERARVTGTTGQVVKLTVRWAER